MTAKPRVMSIRDLQVLKQSFSWLSNLTVLFALTGLGYWGHKNHWKFSHEEAHSHDAAAEERISRTSGKEGHAPLRAEEPATDEHGKLEPVTFQSQEAVQKAGIELGDISERPLNEFVEANGVIHYDQTRVAQLSARVPGTVWRVDKQVGQTVSKGEVLAILDALDVGKAKSEFMQAYVESTLKEQTLERLKSIASVIPDRKIHEAEATFRESRFRRLQARQALLNLGLPVPIGDDEILTDKELTQRLQFLGLPQSVVSQLDPETTTANLIPLVAPFDGIVITREVVIGEVVQPSQLQFVIADVAHMWIRLDIRKEDADRIAIDQPVQFACDGTSHSVTTRLSWIGTSVDEKTRTVPARAEVENPFRNDGIGERLLRANAFGTGRIRVGHRSRALVVPAQALQRDGQSHMVFVPDADGKSFQAHPVLPGIRESCWLEVTGEVQLGQKIVTAGSHLLKSEIVRRRLEGDAE